MSNVLNRLQEIATSVMYAAEAESLTEVLDRIAHIARELVQTRYAAIGIPNNIGGLSHFAFSGISPEQVALIGHLPEGLGLLGVIMTERQPLRLRHMHDHARAVGFPPGHPKMDSLLGVPVLLGGTLYGMLYLCDRLDSQPFDDDDQVLVETLAGYVALAIAGAQTRAQQKRIATLEERERIAMALHDGVIQSLYAVGMHLELIRADTPAHRDELQQVLYHLDQSIEDIRTYIQNLHSQSYHQKTMREVLQETLSRLHIPSYLNVHVKAPDCVVPLSPTVYEAVVQMANEAVSNVVRHAGASQIELIATQADGTFNITIADNGQGFDRQIINTQSGLGLRNIQQRAQLHHGHVDIDTAPGQGTRITISLPLAITKTSRHQ